MIRRGFSITPERQRHGLMLAAGCFFGLAVAWLLWPLDSAALDALRQEVEQLQSQAPAPLRQAQGSAPAESDARQAVPMPDAPDRTESATVWPWLQQRLRLHGLQVQALRPQAMAMSRDLPEQGVSLRLQGRWRDWLAFEKALHTHAPWWVIDQWQVLPVGLQSEEVRFELQGRLGFRWPGVQDLATAHVWPEWPVLADDGPLPGADLFAQVPVPGIGAADASAAEATGRRQLSPQAGAAQPWRLLGIWQQSGTTHAVLDDGSSPVVVRQGQRIGREADREAYLVRRIGNDQVELDGQGTKGQGLRLTLQGDKP